MVGSAGVGTGRRGCGEPAHLINVGAVRAVAGVAGRAGAAARASSCLRADYAGEAGARCAKRHWPHAQTRSASELHSCGPQTLGHARGGVILGHAQRRYLSCPAHKMSLTPPGVGPLRTTPLGGLGLDHAGTGLVRACALRLRGPTARLVPDLRASPWPSFQRPVLSVAVRFRPRQLPSPALFLLFALCPYPSSSPWVPAVLTASIAFHHRILQEGDLLDLPGRKSAGPLLMHLLSVPVFLPRPLPGKPGAHNHPLYICLCTSRFQSPFSLSLARCILSPQPVPRPVLGSLPCSALALFSSLSFSVPLLPTRHCAVSPAPVLTPRCLPLCSLLFSAPSVCPVPVVSPHCCLPLFPYLLSQQLSHVLQRRISLLKFSQHLWGQVSTCIHRGQ